MQLLRAHFENFRLLRDVSVEFSTDRKKPLTVVRAENESGKTTLLTGLQWVLFGEKALSVKNPRLFPIDWNIEDGPVTVTGEIEFTHSTEHLSRRKELVRESHGYIVRRSQTVVVNPGDDFTVIQDSLTLNRLTTAGHENVRNPQINIDQMLNSTVKDLFFTDGDRTLSFISNSATEGERRTMVQQAIRDMLGFEVLEAAKKHVTSARSQLRKNVASHSGDTSLQNIESNLRIAEEERDRCEEEVAKLREEGVLLQRQYDGYQSKLDEALAHGDREALLADKQRTENELLSIQKAVGYAKNEHSDLFKTSSESLALGLLRNLLKASTEKISEQTTEGRIPRTSVAVLQNRLDIGQCICGLDLEPGTERFQNIEKLILRENQTSEVDARLTHLGFQSQSYLQASSREEQSWISKYSRVADNREALRERSAEIGSRLAEIDRQIQDIPDSDVQSIRNLRDDSQRLRVENSNKLGREEQKLVNLKGQIQTLERELKQSQSRAGKADKARCQFEAAEDILEVLTRAYASIEQDAVPKVSGDMNRLFLEMIRADPEAGSVIKKAEITPSYQIIVTGPKGRTLNPDQDLNGASRRALAIAFILALTRTSGVESALVIDTPLGMTSGAVRESITETVVKESTQPVLLLTRAEITGIESILDHATGAFNTMTNATKAPQTVKNIGDGSSIRVCKCSHRQFCDSCEYVGDEQTPGLIRVSG